MNIQATQGFNKNASITSSRKSLRFGNFEEESFNELPEFSESPEIPEISDQERASLYHKGKIKGGIIAFIFCGSILAMATFANTHLQNLNERVSDWNKTLNKQIQQMQKELAERKALENPKNP